MYTASCPGGIAFAGGVRGVLAAPDVSCEPDFDAIREAVTFGGFRLGSRTNVRGVTMVPPASVVTLSARRIDSRRYWTWSSLPQPGDAGRAGLLEETRGSWRHAIARRLEGAAMPGLTLSGGLDSRAILAESARQAGPMNALTYGVAECDDVKFASKAARAVDARWNLYQLYAPGWLDRRTARILETDGLMDLVDLMHVESVGQMPSTFDVYLSGYIGDAVTGSTLFDINNAADVIASMPYYGGTLGMPYSDALALGEEILSRTSGPARFVPYEHKLPQSTNRITAAARPFVRVRRPFVDYHFFEIAQTVPAEWRRGHAWHEEWLQSTYPELFAKIPNQRTAVPVRSSRLRWQVTRTRRFAWRKMLGALRASGLPVRVPERTFHPDERYWSVPDERRRIEETILRRGGLACDCFGRERVLATVREFFAGGPVAVQVIGALYVFEQYHMALPSFVADVRRKAALVPC
jgi:asparagine synthase (glutamine-hydrolysing)